MSRSTTPPPSSARGRPRLRDKLGIPSLFRRLSRSLTPSVRSRTPPPAQSAPSAASLTSPDATSPSNTGSSVTPKTKRWNAAMAECQRRMGVDFLGPETANFRSEKDVMAYIAGKETMEPDSESKGRWQKLQRGLVPLARVSKIFCDPIADTISDSFPPSKIVFAAVGLIISASIATHEEFEQITDALEEIKVHLQVIEMVAGHQGQLLGDTSVDLLVHIIIVLSVIAQMRRKKYCGRFLQAMVDIKPLSDALEDLRRITSLHNEAVIAGTLEAVTNIQASDEMERILAWLKYDSVDSFQRISSLLNDRAKGTCLWFLENHAFVDLMEGQRRVLPIQGQAGCGKSTLLAASNRHLRAYCASRGPGYLVVAHFFDANSPGRGDLDSFLSSFLCQLALRDQYCMSSLAKARQRSISNGYFTSAEKLDTLIGMLGKRLHVFLIVDALDEALDHERTDILGALERLRSCANISTLLSTRVPLSDEGLQSAVVSIDGVEENTDIRTALDIELSIGGRLGSISDAQMVRNELMTKAGGNMRWLTLVIEQLRGAVNDPRRLGRLLKKLPLSLQGLYANRLAATNKDLIGDTELLFAWILYSDKPLTTALLSRVLAFDYGTQMPRYEHTWLSPQPDIQISEILDSTFISIIKGRVHIAHASVREFLVTHLPSSPFYTSRDDAVYLMARTSLSYLLAVVKHDRLTEYDNDLLQIWHQCIFGREGTYYAGLEKDIADVLGQIRFSCLPEGSLSPALFSALIQGHERLVSFLLTNECRCFTPHPPHPNKTALHLAAEHGHPGVAELLLERGAHIAARTMQQDTPLMVAARNGQEDVICLLLDKGADIEDCDEGGYTSLYQAAQRGHLSTISLLLERGARIAARTKQQDTPLTLAAYNGQEGVVCLLLNQGAGIEDCDEGGYTSLHQAARRGHPSTVSLLLERGARIAARTKKQDTPLTLAACSGQEDVVRLLPDKGADIDDCDEDGDTSLHQAAWRGHLGIVSLLLERGANVDAITNVHHTPLHKTAQNGHIDTIRLLVDRGAALEARDEDGWTPLYLAVYNGKEEAIKLLLSLGSDPRTHADDGTTLLDTVGRSRYTTKDPERDERIRELLMRAGCADKAGKIPLEGGVTAGGCQRGRGKVVRKDCGTAAKIMRKKRPCL